MQNKEKLTLLIDECFIEPYKSKFKEKVLPSIRLNPMTDTVNRVSSSKLGGIPFLPLGLNWPRSKYSKNSYSFLGQINLEDLQAFKFNNSLPKDGILYFFFDFESFDDGYIIYSTSNKLYKPSIPIDLKVEKKSFFKRLISGKEKVKVLNEVGVNFSTSYYSPSWNSLTSRKIEIESGIEYINGLIEDKSDYYYDEIESGDENNSNHHLLGWYNGCQNELIELHFINSDSNKDKPSIKEIDEALKWKLLFQLDSDKILNHNYCDWGKLYFFIHEEDLKNKDFSKIRGIGESY